jgi:2-isopropylmalate synthase
MIDEQIELMIVPFSGTQSSGNDDKVRRRHMTSTALKRVSLFDTTLRDGEQAPGNAMSPGQKLDIALGIEALGVDVIESGFPSSSKMDFEATRLIAKALKTARIATLSRAVREDVDIAVEAAGRTRHVLQIIATGSEIHLRHKRGISRDQAEQEVVDAVTHAKSLGVEYVTVGAEDASRGSDELLKSVYTKAVAAGADTISVADTTGCMTPGEYGSLVSRVRSWVGPQTVISTHCHDDLGLSLANALAGIQAGADEVQGTVAGIGERAGNTALEEVIAVLHYKGEEYGCTTSARPQQLEKVFNRLCAAIGLTPCRNKAIVGTNSFATLAGIHQAGMLRAPITYEYVEPELFGRERKMLVGRHSGRAVVRHAFKTLGLAVDERLVDRIYVDRIANSTDGSWIDLDGLKALITDMVRAAA